MSIILILVMLTLSFFAHCTSASHITPDITIKTELVNENEIQLTTSVKNVGDEPAYEVALTTMLPDGSIIVDPMETDILIPNENFSRSFAVFFNENITPGTYPLVVHFLYHDANMYQFTSVNSHLMKTADTTGSKLRGVISETDIKDEESNNATLTIWNDANKPINMTINLFSSNEVKTSFKADKYFIDSLEEKKISFNVEDFGALVGSRYNIFATIEYEDSGYHYTSIAPGKINIVEEYEEPAFEISQNILILIISIFAFIVLLAAFIFYKFKRGK